MVIAWFNADFAAAVKAKLPWFLLTIIGLSFLLLLVAFRSLLIPATAAVMNLLAAAATFGVTTALFQWGWGLGALGLGTPGPVEAFLRWLDRRLPHLAIEPREPAQPASGVRVR